MDQPETVKDRELLAWLAAESDDTQELIVEAAVPERKVSFTKRPGGRTAASGIDSGPAAEREAVLDELNEFLTRQLDSPTTVLKSAGAIAVRATSRQVRAFADHRLVKAIRPNRKFRV